MTIIRARRTQYSAGNADYSIGFSPCAEVQGDFGHVATITPALLSKLGAFNTACSSYSPAPGQTVSTCYTQNIAVKVAAGEMLGTAARLDFSLWDRRVTPLKYANASRWRSFDGRTRRTAAPVGGTIEVDIMGTAQGAWFHPTQPVNPESPHFAIVPDNVDPNGDFDSAR